MSEPDTDDHDRITELWNDIPNTFGLARGELLMELGHHLLDAGRFAEALPVVQTAEDLYAEAADEVALGQAAHDRAVILGRLGRHDEQRAADEESIFRYERGHRPDLAGCSRMSLAQTMCLAGRLKEALPVFAAALADFEAAGETEHAANALMGLVQTNVSLGRFPAAQRSLPAAFAAVTQAAPIPVTAMLHELAAQILASRRGAAAATKALRRARAIWDALDGDEEVASCDIRMAMLAITTDGPAAATTALQSLRLERKEAGDVAGVAACDRGIGLAALARGRPRQAERRFEDASAVFAACAAFADAAECDALAARAAAARGDTDAAARALRRAARELAERHRPVAEVGARLDLARLLLDAGDAAGALRQAKRAEAVARHGMADSMLEEAGDLRHAARIADAEQQTAVGLRPAHGFRT